MAGTTVPTVTSDGVYVDYDDDGDGYSDVDEGDAYFPATTALCDDGSAYASSSDSLDASSTPADMDGDLTCDALDSDRDGDYYSNTVDAFPDDVNEWTDNDGDGTGDSSTVVHACAAPLGMITDGTECDDNNAIAQSNTA